MKLPAYPRTKPSGVEWLGDVPEHWEVKRLDFLARVKARLGWKGLTASEYVPEGFIFLATPNIKGQGEIDFTNVNYITSERYYESPEIMVHVGDVLMAKDGSTLGTTNVVHYLPAPATVNSSVAVLRPKPALNSSYFFRWLTSAYLQSVIQSMKDGQGVPHLFQADIKKFPVLLPSFAEQRSIATFLDRETGRVDLLVAKKRELIERLKEKRIALISRTVTRGLPAEAAAKAGLPEHPRLKPSGIEWLGDVPAHWDVLPLFRIAESIQTGPFGSQLHAADYVEGGIPLINPAHIATGRIVPEESSAVDELTAIRLSRHRLCEGDIVMARRGEIGRCAVVRANEAGWLCGTGSLVIRMTRANPSYYSTIISGAGFSGLLELNAVGTTMLNLNPTIVGRMHVPVPPLNEQAAIAVYLDAETVKLDALVGKVEEAVERLQEYRTALITAAVTGKIDVRKHVNQ